MNVADQIDRAGWLWIIDPAGIDVSDLRPGKIIRAARYDVIQPFGFNMPVWERARRLIEGTDA